MTTYFAIIGTSKNAYGNIRYSLTAYNSEADIIGYANDECSRKGTSLDTLAGIQYVGIGAPDADGDYAEYGNDREFLEGEEFTTALEKLSDDGRRYSIYPDTEEGRTEFLADAEAIGYTERAQALLA